MEWVKANYNEKAMSSECYLDSLNFIGSVANYNVFKDSKGRNYVVFRDQPNLLNHVLQNQGELLAIGLLNPINNKYQYTVELGGVSLDVLTIARVAKITKNTSAHIRLIE